jgi:hypothetical protein
MLVASGIHTVLPRGAVYPVIHGVITNDVSDYVNLLVRIAYIICNHPLLEEPPAIPLFVPMFSMCSFLHERVTVVYRGVSFLCMEASHSHEPDKKRQNDAHFTYQ